MDYVENTFDAGERLKHNLKKYGNLIISLIILVMIGIIGLQYWNKHTTKVAAQASSTYEQLLMALSQNNAGQIQGLGNTLMSNYKSSPYAKMAAFLLAKQAVQSNNLEQAATQLKWVVDNASVESFKAIAQIRLARVYLAQQKAKQALTILQKVDAKNYIDEAAAIKGDAYLELKQPAQAKMAYQKALTSLDKQSPLYAYVEMKLYSI